MSLGKHLKNEREKRGWSQKYVAEKIGITNTVLSNYERNYRDPDTNTLKKLADLYEVSTDYLLDRSNTPHHKTKEDDFDSLAEINRLIKEYGIEQSGFFDIEKWKAMGSEEIKQLESYFQFLVSESQKHYKKDK